MLTDERLAEIRERADVLLWGDIKDDVEELLDEIDRLRALLAIPAVTVSYSSSPETSVRWAEGQEPDDA